MFKITIALMITLLAGTANATITSSRSRFSCGFDKSNAYELELAIDDIGDEEGTVTVIESKTNKAVRTEKAYFKDGVFSFGKNESISLGTYDDFNGEFTVIYGVVVVYGSVSMGDLNGDVHCHEIQY